MPEVATVVFSKKKIQVIIIEKSKKKCKFAEIYYYT